MPSAPVPTLPPSASVGMGCGHGASTANSASPRTQCGTVTSMVRTLANPRRRISRNAQPTAAASPGEPAGRGPTSVVSDSTSC